MSTILGIVAEYDPFHNGHQKHLRLARERVQPDFTYAVISGCFKQRGEMAMLSPWDRAACALEAGADAVFLLPTAWTVRDAEHYALGAVALLNGLGTTHLAFGAETGEPEILRRTAERLNSPTEAFSEKMKEALADGEGYPAALSQAMAWVDPEAAEALRKPNNLLGICYMRAIRELDAEMESVIISREGDYHAADIDPDHPSASAVRKALARGDFSHGMAAMPEESAGRVRSAMLAGRIPKPETLDALLIHRLRGMSREEAECLPDVSEGLGNRLLTAARQVSSREELLDAVCSRRYPRGRISRICAWALMGRDRQTLERIPLPRETLLLGLKKNPEMTEDWRQRDIRIVSSLKAYPPDPAWSVWSQCAFLPEDWPYRQKTIVK